MTCHYTEQRCGYAERDLELVDDLLYLSEHTAPYYLLDHDKKELAWLKTLCYCDHCIYTNGRTLNNNVRIIGERLGMGFVE